MTRALVLDKTITPLIYVIFIGGAADKESFLWGNINLPFVDTWPHKTMYRVSRYFNYRLLRKIKEKRTMTKAMIAHYYRSVYLSYTEVCYPEIKHYDPALSTAPMVTSAEFETLLRTINSKTHVYIIGHSLGAWNGAHLSGLLANHGITSTYLVTLDPVGMGNHDFSWAGHLMKQAQIYTQPPIPVAKKWMNIRGFQIELAQKHYSESIEDWVAWAGGQWLIDQNNFADQLIANELTNISHKRAEQMFNYQTKLGYSASEAVEQSIIDVIEKEIG